MADLPNVAVFSTGGTIASVKGAVPGVTPRLTAAQLVQAVPQLAQVAEVSANSFRQVSSNDITMLDLLELVQVMRRPEAAGTKGFVITQGTDTMEETSFFLDLLWDGQAPIVVTGAMRNHSLPGADGPANLLAAIQVAASDAAQGIGAVVVLNDEIHAARFVRKTHTSNLATFRSPLTGPIGWVSEGMVRIATRPVGRHHIALPPDVQIPPVALVTFCLGDDGRLFEAAERIGYAGVVVEGTGGGHVSTAIVEILDHLAKATPVIVASRTGCGETLRATYGFPGAERDLIQRGLIVSGYLDGRKSRLLLTLLLAGGATREEVKDAFAIVGAPASEEALQFPSVAAR